MGNARIIRQLSSLLPFSTSPKLWSRHLQWATHVADVSFVEASMTANRLVDAASQQAAILQNPKISNTDRNEVRKMLEMTVKQLAPLERSQGNILLGLGRVMLDAVGALHLRRTEGFMAERRRRDEEVAMGMAEEEDAQVEKQEIPENDLVRETRQVLIRGENQFFIVMLSSVVDKLFILPAAALFENAYASFLKSPQNLRKTKFEQRLLRRVCSFRAFLTSSTN